jgi:dihydroneopterin aldolase
VRERQDRVFVEGMIFSGRCGITEQERKTRRKVVVDMEVVTSLAKPGKSDELRDTVDYSKFYELAKKVVQGKTVNLLEHWAEMVAEEVLGKFKVNEVRVRIRKLGALPKGASPGVEIVRKAAS